VQGHKRWDHSINQGYTKVLELLQENLLPALDRCTAILTNLRGLAQYHEHSTAFDVPLSSFSLLLDIIRCIRLISYHMILLASQEYHHFLAFSRWLRHSITVQGADPTTAAGEDAIDKDPGIDYLAVMTYIQNAMEESSIAKYISEPVGSIGLKASPNIYDDLKEALNLDTTKVPQNEDILKLSSYYSEWKGHNRILVEQITSWQRKTTICAGGIVLSNGKSSALDMRMVWKVRSPFVICSSHLTRFSLQLKAPCRLMCLSPAKATHPLSTYIISSIPNSSTTFPTTQPVRQCPSIYPMVQLRTQNSSTTKICSS
jgi:anaphase-promoting complex subunit 4